MSTDMALPNWLRFPTATRSEVIASGLIGALIGGVVTAILTPLVAPALTRAGEGLSARIYPSVIVQSCAPLKSARVLLSYIPTNQSRRTLADFPHHMRNETYLYVENRSGKTLKNVLFSVYPISQGSSQAELMTASLMSTSLHRSSDYTARFDAPRRTFTIAMPALGNSESILLNQVFDSPVGFVVELTAEDFTLRKLFSFGCSDEIVVNDLIQNFEIAYVSNACKVSVDKGEPTNNCSYTDESPINITDDMRGGLIQEQLFIVRDPLKLTVPELARRK